MHSWPLGLWPLLTPRCWQPLSIPWCPRVSPVSLRVTISWPPPGVATLSNNDWMEWWNASDPHKHDVTFSVPAESDKIRSEYRWMNRTFWWYLSGLTPAPAPLQSYPELRLLSTVQPPAISQLSLASISLSASAVLKPGLAWPDSRPPGWPVWLAAGHLKLLQQKLHPTSCDVYKLIL